MFSMYVHGVESSSLSASHYAISQNTVFYIKIVYQKWTLIVTIETF